MLRSHQRPFSEELERFGPQGNAAPLSETEALEYCARLARGHYENFTVASLLLPPKLRKPFQIVYAYCRWSDDLADEHDGSGEALRHALERLDWWEQKLDECFSADGPEPRHPVFVALKSIIEPFRLRKKPFADLLVAFRRDQVQHRYETLDDLLDYCRYSADPVGRIVLQLGSATFGTDAGPTPEELAWSDSICTGLQLANFWQDVARDAVIGRCYIPADVAGRYGVEGGSLRETDEFRDMLAELVRDARNRLLFGVPLVNAVSRPLRVDISLFIRGGLAVLDAIERNGYNVLSKRPVVTRRDKIRLLLTAWLRPARF